MDCTTCQELFSEYWDRQLNNTLVATIGRHLEQCPACAQEWEYFQQTITWLHELRAVAAPQDLQAGILARIAAPAAPNSLWQRIKDWFHHTDFSLSLPQAAATVGVALAVMLLVKNHTQPRLQPAASPDRPHHARQTTGRQTHRLAGTPTTPKRLWQRPGLLEESLAAVSSTPSLNYIVGRPAGTELAERLFHRQKQSLTSQPPDMVIAVKNNSFEERLALYRKLLTGSRWTADIFNADTVFVEIDPCRLNDLHRVLAGKQAEISPPIAKHAAFGAPKKALTVAVVLQ